MIHEIPYQYELALTGLRIITGLLFLLQGYDKVFRLGIKGVYRTFHEPMSKKNMPSWVLWSSAYYTSLVELVGGALLIVGLFTPWAALFILVDLILVAAAFGILEPMWDMKHFFPRMILILAVLFMPYTLNIFSIDYLLTK
jgi:putative oxidoreductase